MGKCLTTRVREKAQRGIRATSKGDICPQPQSGWLRLLARPDSSAWLADGVILIAQSKREEDRRRRHVAGHCHWVERA